MTLAETYALASAVLLGKPVMPDAFFPLDHPLDKVILIHAFAAEQERPGLRAAPAKVYEHFDEVVALLRPILDPAGYKIFQIGAPGEPQLRGIESLVGKTNLHQCAYLVKNCAVLIGNDSIWAHVRGASNRPLVALYGSTGSPHFPHWRNLISTALIESHRGGKKPSFASHEFPKTINWITPESVANAALAFLLELPNHQPLNHRSLFIGQAYNQHLVELVPNVVVTPALQMSGPMVVRMDYVSSGDDTVWKDAEGKLASNLQIRKCAIVSDREITLSLLAQLKGNIAQLQLDVTKLSPAWIKAVKKLGIPTGFFSNETDAGKLSALRLALYDACLFDQVTRPTKEDVIKGAAVYLNKELDKDLKWDTVRFKTNRMLLSDDKIYLSKAHWLAGKNTPNTDQNRDFVIDNAEFWAESPNHYYFLS